MKNIRKEKAGCSEDANAEVGIWSSESGKGYARKNKGIRVYRMEYIRDVAT